MNRMNPALRRLKLLDTEPVFLGLKSNSFRKKTSGFRQDFSTLNNILISFVK